MTDQIWAKKLISRIDSIIFDRLKEAGVCHVMLTGGRSAERLYKIWSKTEDSLITMPGVQIYFGDERDVAIESVESNYRLVRVQLFPSGIPSCLRIHRMEADDPDINDAAERYSNLLPEKIDVLLLSVGEDGHIASLFPGAKALKEYNRTVLPVLGPKFPFQRLTITPAVISAARHVFVLALGNEKRRVYDEALQEPIGVDDMPVRMVLSGTWIFES